MNNDTHSNPTLNQLPEVVRDTYQTLASKVEESAVRTKDFAQHAVDMTQDAAHRTTETAKEIYQSTARKAGDTVEIGKDYVRRNPVPVVLGAIAFGAAIGYLILSARRKPTFSERYADEPLAAAREVILTALAPVTQRVHESYDTARNRADRTAHSLSDQIGRLGSNLKFW